METNLSRWEAVLRLVIGSLLFIYFIIGGPWWAIFGIYLMLTGAFRFCLFYFYLSDRQV